MNTLHRQTTDERLDAPAEDAFTPEGGTHSATQSERERQMAEYSVGHDGLRYHYNGYRYDRWEDAVAYASLMRSRPRQVDTGGPFAPNSKKSAPTTDAEFELMISLGIGFEDGAYRFEGFRYDKLSDAVNYAKLPPQRQ